MQQWGMIMGHLSSDKYYDEQYYGRSYRDNWIKLPFSKHDYYGTPLCWLGCKAGDKLLDVACGDGQLIARAESLGLQCWGIDISQVAIDRARSRCRATIVCADVNNGLPYDDNFFDYVTCLGSLEHFERQVYVLHEIHRVTKASGRIYILVSNGDYILYKLSYETDYQPIINRYSLVGYRDLLTKSGFAIDYVLCDNSHLSNLSESSSLLKFILKLIAHPFIRFIPLRYSYNFIFICRPVEER
jgi:ubiquinone/menaquinone biosynthesis C-methylase UbiE